MVVLTIQTITHLPPWPRALTIPQVMLGLSKWLTRVLRITRVYAPGGPGHLGREPGRVSDARKDRCSSPSGVVHNSPRIAHSAPKLNKARMRSGLRSSSPLNG